jgi:hypothetical protein
MAKHKATPPAGALSFEPDHVERTIVVVDVNSDRCSFGEAVAAVVRGPWRWHVHATYGLTAGVRAALALQADHVVLCVGEAVDKPALMPWVQRLRAIVGIQILGVWDTRDALADVEEQIGEIGLSGWCSTDRVSGLERAICDWEPTEKWLKPPKPWTPPLLRAAN